MGKRYFHPIAAGDRKYLRFIGGRMKPFMWWCNMRVVIDDAFNEPKPEFLKQLRAREASKTRFESGFIDLAFLPSSLTCEGDRYPFLCFRVADLAHQQCRLTIQIERFHSSAGFHSWLNRLRNNSINIKLSNTSCVCCCYLEETPRGMVRYRAIDRQERTHALRF
jgi:hypothetical protein